MKKKFISVLLIIMLLTGCNWLDNGPDTAVKKFLNNYKNNADVVIEELNDYLNYEKDLTDDEKEEYRELYLRQYSDMEYSIQNHTINGDEATVTVEITVYDYYKTNINSDNYITSNQNDFINENGDIDLSKYLTYKINKMLDTTDRVTYTMDLNLTKIDKEWEINPLTNDQISKLHGTYEY